jgi:hypothetical protein
MNIRKILSGALWVASVLVSTVPVWCAEGVPGSDKSPRAKDSTPQQSTTSTRSTDTTENQSSTEEVHTGSDLTGGRDSHLGPHDPQDTPKEKKTKKGTAGTGR